MRAFTSKPVLLSETAVGPDAGQFVKIPNLFEGWPATRRSGWCGSTRPSSGGIYHQDWRIEDNQQAEIAFRLSVSQYLAPYPPAG